MLFDRHPIPPAAAGDNKKKVKNMNNERKIEQSDNVAAIGIGAMILFWLTVRFIGPAAGWWTLADTP